MKNFSAAPSNTACVCKSSLLPALMNLVWRLDLLSTVEFSAAANFLASSKAYLL